VPVSELGAGASHGTLVADIPTVASCHGIANLHLLLI